MDHQHHHHHHHHLHHQQQQQLHQDHAVALDSGRWLEDDEQYDHEPVTVAYTFRRGVPGLAAHTIIYHRRRLYAGYRLHLLRDTIGTAIYFTTYESAKQLMANSPWPVPVGTPCGAASGAVITALSCPFELTKLNEQLAGKVAREAQSKSGQNPSPIVDVKSGGSWNTARRLIRDRGVLGLYACDPALPELHHHPVPVRPLWTEQDGGGVASKAGGQEGVERDLVGSSV
ncbi:hypothetical protein NU195Hw_g1532t1 [Hortaea werneckii]